jgi:hypothetical protein
MFRQTVPSFAHVLEGRITMPLGQAHFSCEDHFRIVRATWIYSSPSRPHSHAALHILDARYVSVCVDLWDAARKRTAYLLEYGNFHAACIFALFYVAGLQSFLDTCVVRTHARVGTGP